MKKIIAIALTLAILMAALPFALTAYAEDSAAKVTVEGVEYSLDIGDVISYTYYLDLSGIGGKPGKLTELEGSFYYDKQMLRVITEWDADEDYFDEVLPNISGKGTVSVSDDSKERLGYAASLKSGYSFSSRKVMIQVDFEVIAEGESTILHQLTCMGSGEVRLIENGEVFVAPVTEAVVVIIKKQKPTEAPTEAPTQAPTEAPVTEAPVTQAPATQAPATQAPATQAPATQAPVTEAPATQAPATQAPATQAPATQAPATQAPATQAPATQAPATQAPATQAPTAAPTQAPTQAPTFIVTDPNTGISVISDTEVSMIVTKVNMKRFGYILTDCAANDSVYSITLIKGGNIYTPDSPVTVVIPRTAGSAAVCAVNNDGTVTYPQVIDNGRIFAVTTDSLAYLAVLTEGQQTDTYELGDVDLDREVSILDATYIQRALVGLNFPGEFQWLLADTDKDGEPSILDATAIQRWLVGLPNTFRPV